MPRVDERAQLAPAEVQARIERLAVDRARRGSRASRVSISERARQAGRQLRADGVGDRRKDVDELHRRRRRARPRRARRGSLTISGTCSASR